jgi:hypothetical protein
MPQHFASKKVFRWVEHGVKGDFKKGLTFAPKPSDQKFVDPQDVDFPCPLQSQRGHGQASNHQRGSSHDQVRGQTPRFMMILDVESVFFHVPIHPKHRKFFSSHLTLPLFVNNKFIELHPEGYFVCTRPDLASLLPSAQTLPHLRRTIWIPILILTKISSSQG